MSEIANNLNTIISELSDDKVKLIAVSKTKPNEALLEAYNAGQRDFGENKVQELSEKFETLPKDIRWHMIGHLQRNKVKQIAPFVHLIHSVDSIRLLREINKQGEKYNRTINCLLQIHIAEESTKFGFNEKDLEDFLKSKTLDGLQNIIILGLMGMATFTEDNEQINREFAHLKSIFDDFSSRFLFDNFQLKELSMGMSGDYALAIANGSTMIRVGSSIFGSRNYG